MTYLKLYPGAQTGINTQIHIENNIYQNSPPTRPFIIYPGTDITGTATGNSGAESYCSLPTTTASRYRLDRENHNQLFQYRVTIDNISRIAYCLDKSREFSINDEPCNSTPFETLFQEVTQQKRLMLSWILANTFPSRSATDTFSLANVDGTTSPILDDNDAYAVVSVSLWVVLDQMTENEVKFIDCKNGEIHPKSNRLRTAVLNLLKLAMAYANTALNQTLNSTSRQAPYSKQAFIHCCSQQTIPSDPATPYLIFDRYPNEVKTINERVLFGPFLLRSSSLTNPTLTIEPFCDCYDDLSASFADFNGNPITPPKIGQEFYISIRTTDNFLCFTLRASLNATITRVITMNLQSSSLNYQPIGTCLYDYNETVTSELRICVLNPNTQTRLIQPLHPTPSTYSQSFPPTYRQGWWNPWSQYASVTEPPYPTKPQYQARPSHPPKPPKPCPPEPCPPGPYTPEIAIPKSNNTKITTPETNSTVENSSMMSSSMTNSPTTDIPGTNSTATKSPETNPPITDIPATNFPVLNSPETFDIEYELNNDYLSSIGDPPCPW